MPPGIDGGFILTTSGDAGEGLAMTDKKDVFDIGQE
jgi:hypothetical protein